MLELGLQRARTTNDVDLRLMGPPDGLLERLREAGRLDLGDWTAFEIAPHEHPAIRGDRVKYKGQRFLTLGR